MAGDPATQTSWLGLRDHPRFREAAERAAGGILAQKDRVSPAVRWLTNNFARAAVLTQILIHEAANGEVTVADLLAKARRQGTASDGRVLQVLNRARAAGLVEMDPSATPWRARRIRHLPLLTELWRERAAIEIDAASLVVPEIWPALALIEEPDGLRRFLAHLARFDGMALEVRGPANPAFRLFIAHNAGLSILYDLLLRQAAERTRLLESAPLSRSALARRFSVSRVHVSRLFAAAEATGCLVVASGRRVDFAPAMSEEAERHFALTFHAIASCALAAMS